MLTEQARKDLEKQQYRIVGAHSAVKVCGWTKKMIRGEGGCYKLKFYGIVSSQCLQMTSSISCANRCIFCWRGYKAPVSKEWKWTVDEPSVLVHESMKAHHNLLTGFGGHEDTKVYERAKTIKHVALSLTGEPIAYPKINELIEQFHKQGISTFLVTNGQYPEQIKKLQPITQLYLSLDAPTEKLMKEIDAPLFKDYWTRMQQSLEHLAEKSQRTCIRITLLKNINMTESAAYAKLILKGNPDFIEVKAYMFVGASRQRLSLDNMPLHEEVVEFTKQLVKKLPGYSIVSEHIPSRVVLLAKREFLIADKWNTWIDFPKFIRLASAGKDFSAFDYVQPTRQTGISGKGTLDSMSSEKKKKLISKLAVGTPPGHEMKVNEKTDEIEFWDAKAEK